MSTPRRAVRLDLRFDDITGGPSIHLWADDGTHHTYPLTPHVAAVVVKRLAGYVAAYLRPPEEPAA